MLVAVSSGQAVSTQAGGGWCRPFRLMTSVSLSVFAIGVALTSFQAAAADGVKSATQNKIDERRAHSGANVTKEIDPDEASSTKSDSERVSDSYQAKGVELGQFLLMPKLEVDELFNSNVYASEKDLKGDFVTTVRPEVKLRSRFAEHEINLTLLAEHLMFRKYRHDDRTELQADVSGRYDFDSNLQANLSSSLYSRHEDRGSPDDANGLKPTAARGWTSRLGFKLQEGRYTLVGEVGADRRAFGSVTASNGTVTSNADRDRWELSARQRGSYEIFPGYSAVIELSQNLHQFDRTRDRSGFKRGSVGYRAETGVGVDVSQLIRGDFLVGYFQQRYVDRQLGDVGGLSLRATFNWTPSKLTIVVPSFERVVNDTTTANAAAMLHNGFSVTVRHELQRNIILTGYGAIGYDTLSGVKNQNSWIYETRARMIYAFTPEVYVGGEIAYKNKVAEASGGGFSQLTTMMKLGLQL